MPKRSGHTWRMTVGLFLAGAGVFCLMYLTAKKLYYRGVFVNDKLYATEIAKISRRHGVDPRLVRAVIFQESRFVRDAVGRQGEVGLMQVLPKGAVADWARENKKPHPSHAELIQVEQNLEIGIWYLAKALKRWEGCKDQIPLALIQYNAGANRAVRWKPASSGETVMSRIGIASTRAYVKNIMERYRKYCGEK